MEVFVRTLTDGREVLIYPFALSTGQIAVIELPAEPLTHDDAERLAAYVSCLVIPHDEVVRQLTASGKR